MDDRDTFPHHRAPTPARPLLGLTILVVEDSRFACEALRLLCLKSGARIRRADCLRSARRHLQVYRPSAVIIDLGLPDGSGLDLIEELSATHPRVSVILATSADDGADGAALKAGADGFLAKPVASLGAFQQALLQHLPADRQPVGPRALAEETVSPDPLAYQDDMAHAADVLDDGKDDKTLDYVAQFLSGVARAANDTQLERAANGLARCRAKGEPSASAVARVAGIVQRRMTDSIAI